MKWIRWPGLFLFAGIVGLIAALWLLFAGPLVRRIIETAGTEAVGARVELTDAGLSLSPLSVTLSGLRVTNPDRPMENIVDVERVAFGVDAGRLLQRRLIIDEMTVSGLRLNTPRKHSGALPESRRLTGRAKRSVGRAAGAAAGAALCDEDGFSLPSFSLPDVQSVLSREKLAAAEAVESLRRDIDAHKTAWESRLKELPGRETFAGYRDRLKKLKAPSGRGIAGLAGAATEIPALKRDIETDLRKLTEARSDFEKMSAELKKRAAEARRSPQAEARRLASKYTLTPDGLQSISRRLFGLHLCGGVEKALAWYRRLAPYFGGLSENRGEAAPRTKPRVRRRGAGAVVRFAEKAPVPDFLIRKLLVSADIDSGRFDGRVENITTDPELLGQPLRFLFEGEKLPMLARLKLDGVLDHVHPQDTVDRLNAVAAGLKLRDIAIADNRDFMMSLDRSLADLTLAARLHRSAPATPVLEGSLTAGLADVHFDVPDRPGRSPVAQALADAVRNVSRLDIQAGFKGPPDRPEISIRSNLDTVVTDAVASLVGKQAAGLQEKLRTEIGKRMKGALDGLDGELSSLAPLAKDLEARLDTGNETLRQAVGAAGGGLKLPF